MATTNYTLPTLESTALFDLVTDYNALANATDAALASVAELIPTESIATMQGQIAAIQTSVSGNTSNINKLQGQMTTANDNISTLSTGLATANNSIGTLQSGLQLANNNISEINTKAAGTTLTTLGEVSGTKFGKASAKYSYNPLINLIVVTISSNQWASTTSGDASEQIIGNLPEGKRPSTDIRVFMDFNSASSTVTQGRVYSNGKVSIIGIGGTINNIGAAPLTAVSIPFLIIPESELL